MALDGWLTRLTNWLANVWEAFAEFGIQLFEKVQRWWVVILGVLMTVITMTKTGITFAWGMLSGVLTTLEAVFGNITSLDQAGAFSGAPWGSALSVINAFVPLTEIMAGASVLATTYAAILLVRSVQWLVKTIKWVLFQWL